MRRWSLIFIAALLAVSAHASEDALWERAVAHFAASANLLPGRMQTTFVQYNGRGKLVRTDVNEVIIRVDSDGEIVADLVYSETDGEDVTSENRGRSRGGVPFARGRDDDDDGNDPFGGLDLSPFDPEEQHKVAYKSIGPESTLEGIRVQEFEFTHETEQRRNNIGRAWVAVDTGEPVALELTLEPLPVVITEFIMRQEFGRDADGRLIMERMEFIGEGTLVLVRRRIESELVFSNYFPSP